jgi:hypothetical protein
MGIVMAYAFTYVVAHGLAYIDETNCQGWNCEVVNCNKGYAVFVPEKNAYLPCEKFDDFINGNSEVLIGNK